MSELRTIFRSCPNCGKRFEIHITGKKLVDEKVVSNKVETPIISPTLVATGPSLVPTGSMLTPMREGVTTVDEKEFQVRIRVQTLWSQMARACGKGRRDNFVESTTQTLDTDAF